MEKTIDDLANSDLPVPPGYEHWVFVSRTLLQCFHAVDDSGVSDTALEHGVFAVAHRVAPEHPREFPLC